MQSPRFFWKRGVCVCVIAHSNCANMMLSFLSHQVDQFQAHRTNSIIYLLDVGHIKQGNLKPYSTIFVPKNLQSNTLWQRPWCWTKEQSLLKKPMTNSGDLLCGRHGKGCRGGMLFHHLNADKRGLQVYPHPFHNLLLRYEMTS